MKYWMSGAIAAMLALAMFALPGASTGTVYAVPSGDACGNGIIDVPDSRPGLFDFTDACLAHDACYGQGGTEQDRRTCDQDFLSDMLASCQADNAGQRLKIRYCNTVAYTYFLGVRIGGGAFFPYSAPV